MTYTAIVPARSGSKRLPNKNIKLLAGKPLVLWTLEACLGSQRIDKVILSTDSKEYWELAKLALNSERLALDFRDESEAGDTVKIFDYLKNRHDKIFGDSDGAFILALPTVPLRTSQHIDEAIDIYEQGGRPIFSATNYGFPVSFSFSIASNGDWSPVFEDSPMITGNTRSQNQQDTYHPNGAIYIRDIQDLSRPELKTLYDGARPYLMDRMDSVDIDNEIDFVVAEAILKTQK